jgi:hypothetical protein
MLPTAYNRHRSLFTIWKNWMVACSNSADSDICSEHELKRRSDYLAIPLAQLRWVSAHKPDSISLLERRMEALSLDPDEVLHIEPRIVRQLQQRCVNCAKLDQCSLDLADEFADCGWHAWRDYCPNAATLTMLSTFQNFRTSHK